MTEANGWRDPFDVPAHLLPPGMIYQWCAKEVRGVPDKQFQQMLEAGWQPVPRRRHGDFFGDKYAGDNGSIQYGGQVLMERPRAESNLKREREIDDACRNGRTGRLVVVQATIPVKLNLGDLAAAKAEDLAGSEYAIKRLRLMAEGIDATAYLRGWNGALQFEKFQSTRIIRRARWHAFQWLFNLISHEVVETTLESNEP